MRVGISLSVVFFAIFSKAESLNSNFLLLDERGSLINNEKVPW